MSARLQRAARLIDLASRAERSAKQATALAQRQEHEARCRAESAEHEWSSAASRPLAPSTGALELERLDAHLKTLRLRANTAARLATEAAARYKTAADASLEASVDRRKLELWHEGMQAAEVETAARDEAKAFDELAASGWRARS